MPRLLPTVAQPNPSAMSRSPEPAHNHVLETQPTHEREHGEGDGPCLNAPTLRDFHSIYCTSRQAIGTIHLERYRSMGALSFLYLTHLHTNLH